MSASKRAAAVSGLLFATLALFLFYFASTRGFEGDDIAQMSGISHLRERGPEHVYRYYWQPLNYELAHALAKLGLPLRSLVALPAAAAALSVTLLVAAVRAHTKTSWPLAIAWVLFVPELWITGLYFNSSAAAEACVAGALLISAGPSRPKLRGLAIGTLAACSALFRMEFVLGLPLLGCVLLFRSPLKLTRTSTGAAILLGAGGTLLVTWGLGLFSPARILMASRLASQDAVFFGWTLRDSLRVLSTASPALLLFAVALLSSLLRRSSGTSRRDMVQVACWCVAVAIACVVIRNLLTPKYLLPALCFLPLYLGEQWSRAAAQLPRISNAAVGVGLLACYLVPSHGQVHTHDGPRVRYGYLAWVMGSSGPRQYMPIVGEFAYQLARRLAARAGQCTVVYGPSGVSDEWTDEWGMWAWPALYLEQEGFTAGLLSLESGVTLDDRGTSVTLRPRPAAPVTGCDNVVYHPRGVAGSMPGARRAHFGTSTQR